jgi:hypothetical protein
MRLVHHMIVSLGVVVAAQTTVSHTTVSVGVRISPLQVEPKEYGPNLTETIKKKLVEVVENTCSERYGFILKVFNVDTDRLEAIYSEIFSTLLFVI